MLVGYDLSSHNTTTQLADALTKDFVIVKASEGVTYRNPVHDDWVAQARTAGVLVGHYHYARPESNGPEAEARAFLAATKAQPGDVLVLDFEPPSIMPAYPSWAIAFGNAVTAATGAPCWFYTNQSQGNTMVSLSGSDQKAALFKMPLWKAYYQSTIGDLMGWPTWACWQHTSTPIDTNRFNGDAAQWRSLGVPEEDAMPTTDEIVKALRADMAKFSQEADGSWPLGAQVAYAAAQALRSENVSGVKDDAQIQKEAQAVAKAVAAALPADQPIDTAAIAKAVADEQYRRLES